MMINFDDTIVAIATPLGEGGLGVVRLSGPGSIVIADKIFKGKKKLNESVSHTLHHGWIGSIDEVVAGLFLAPKSYTGETVVEFSCHGSPTVLKEIVRLAIEHGARQALPGEFTQRAYLNQKLDLIQAEAVADLIHAQSKKAGQIASAQLEGQLSIHLNNIRQPLINLMAQIEANLDFVEEKIPIVSSDQTKHVLLKVYNDIQSLLSTSLRGRLIKSGLRVVLAGRPNVGKSSLFNALLAQERAIVTNIPGTTRDTLEEKVVWDGIPVVLVDTAGLRSVSSKVERIGAARAKKAQESADIVILVMDARSPWTKADHQIAKQIQTKRLICALNKIDCVKTDKKPLAEGVLISAKTGAGLESLKKSILELILRASPETQDAYTIVNERHVRHLENAANQIKTVLDAVANGADEMAISEETIAVDLRSALNELSALTGENTSEDVLNSIFRQFCIGK